jgi:hypothetical protein
VRITAIGAALLLAATLSGCASAGPGGERTMGPLASPSASGPASSAPPSTPPTSAPPTSAKPASFPTTPKGYADATMSAWTSHKDERLADLTTDDAGASIATVPGGIDAHWHYNQCEGAAGASYCVYDNNNGDRVQLRIDNATVGQPGAVVEFKYDPTVYAAVPDDYVNAFMQAWKDGNTRRMQALSTSQVTSYFTHYTPQDTWTLADDSGAGHTHVVISNADGFSQTVDVLNLQLAQPHAIEAVCNPGCA